MVELLSLLTPNFLIRRGIETVYLGRLSLILVFLPLLVFLLVLRFLFRSIFLRLHLLLELLPQKRLFRSLSIFC